MKESRTQEANKQRTKTIPKGLKKGQRKRPNNNQTSSTKRLNKKDQDAKEQPKKATPRGAFASVATES